MGAACSGNRQPLIEDGQTISLLVKDKKENQRKLLLLGSGDSGKSTLFRHMSFLYTGSLSEAQRRNYGFLIVEAIVEWMQTTVNERRSGSQQTQECTDAFLADEEAVLTATASDFKDIVSPYKRLWETDAYKKVWERHSKIHLPAFFPYFVERLGAISEPDYLATDEDILHVRLRTTGVQSVHWESPDGLQLELVDVGGQRSERRKWMHCFEDVSAVLYVVDVSSYGETCWEDSCTQCMTETLNLFHDIVTSEFLKDSLIFLVCNKDDRLRERASKVPLVDSDPTYHGPNEYDAVFQHLHNKFQNIFNDADQFNRTLMIVKTNAVDTSCISSVYNDILKSVTQNQKRKDSLDDNQKAIEAKELA